jgi:invasion protein IalB
MIWSRDRVNTLRDSASRGIICAGAAALALGVAMPLALAQQGQVIPKTTQAPKAQAAPAAGAPAGAPPAPNAPATFGDAAAPEDAWVKLCMKNEQTQNKQIWLINHERLEPNTGMVLIAAAVRQAEGEDNQQLIVRVPTA